MQETTRYLGLFTGLGGIIPAPAGEVLANGYGDCKGLGTLLIALLRAVGIDAWPVLVRTGHVGPLAAATPNPIQFNHYIVWADDGADGYYYTIETLELADVPPVMCGLAQVGLTNLSIINTGNYMEVVVDQTGGPMAGNQSIQVLGDVEGTALGMPVGPAPLMDFIGVLPEGEVAFGGSDTTVTYSPDNTVIATAMPEVMPGIAVTVTLTGLDGEMTFAM